MATETGIMMCTLGHLRQGPAKCPAIPDRGAMGFWALVSGVENIELSSSLGPHWGWFGWAATPSELQGRFWVEPPWPALGVPYGESFRFCLGPPPWHPIPRFFFAVGPRAGITGVIWRGAPARPGAARGGQPDVGRASLEDPPKLSSAGRGGGSGAPSQVPPGGCPLQAQAGCPSEAKKQRRRARRSTAPGVGMPC